MLGGMRTLPSQVRLRRLIRIFGEARARIRGSGRNRAMVRSVEQRLLEQARALRECWDQDSLAAAPDTRRMAGRHVIRVLAGIEVMVVRLGQPGANLDRLGTEFLDLALPLMFYLRGLEETPEDQVISLLAS
jgi:hypothetical protein